MSTPSWRISRRTMLHGLGVAIALPMLEAMGPDLLADEPVAEAAGPKFKPPRTPVRLLMMNLPCGTYRKEWGVDKAGPIGEFGSIAARKNVSMSSPVERIAPAPASVGSVHGPAGRMN